MTATKARMAPISWLDNAPVTQPFRHTSVEDPKDASIYDVVRG
jgi:hypothetical protein